MRNVLFHRARGQAMVMMALSITALMTFGALVVDAGFFLIERRHLQNAADAAALAANWKLLDEHASRAFRDNPVAQAADQVARLNGVDVGGTRQLQGTYVDANGAALGTVGAGGQFQQATTGVRVTLSGQFNTMLSPLVSPNGIQATAEGQAHLLRVGFPATLVNPAPVTAPLAAFTAGQSFDLFDQQLVNTVYGITGYDPLLDLAHPNNGGGGYVAATSYGSISTNIELWSNGTNDSGTVGIGTRVALAGGGGGNRPRLRDGLRDRVTLQGLVAPGGQYCLIGVPIWDTYIQAGVPGDPDLVEMVGFAWFKVLWQDIGVGSLFGYFVPYIYDPGNTNRVTGPFWGPSVVALTR